MWGSFVSSPKHMMYWQSLVLFTLVFWKLARKRENEDKKVQKSKGNLGIKI